MHSINPVLSGRYDDPGYTPNAGNLSLKESAAFEGVDPRRGTKFDRSAANTAYDPSFRFADALDAVNPLQHIPVLSSLVRGITGDDIHPTARVAGDILYGGVGSLTSAITGGVVALSDEVMASTHESQTGVAGTVLASLLSDPTETTSPTVPTTQIATAETAQTSTAPTQLSPSTPSSPSTARSSYAFSDADKAQAKALLSASLGLPLEQLANPSDAVVNAINAETAAQHVTAAASSINTAPPTLAKVTPDPLLMATTPQPTAHLQTAGQAIPLPTAKAYPIPGRSGDSKVFSGVMNATNERQMQDMAISLAQGQSGTSIGGVSYTGRLTGAANKPIAIPQTQTLANIGYGGPSSSLPSIATASAGGKAPTTLPKALMDNIMSLKGISQYQSVASHRPSPAGSMLNVME